MARADDLVEHERDRVKTLEQTLKLLQSNPTSSSSSSNQTEEVGQDEDEQEKEEEGGTGTGTGSKIENLEMKGLSVMQRRKIMMLRNKRDKLEQERIKLGLGED